jgi:endo-1,4-beta-xylanase
MHISRRNAIGMAVLAAIGSAAFEGYGASATAATIPATQAPNAEGLAALGAACGMKVGIQCGSGRFAQPVLGPFLRSNFNLFTAPLKWTSLRPAPDKYDFTEADRQFVDAKTYGIAVHGHNLCWNTSNPSWFDAVLNTRNARDFLEDHIKTVAGRFRGKVDSWDVVNEPIATWNKRSDALRTGPWLNLIGPEYIDVAFHATQAADPAALRTLNLNGCEDQTSAGEATRAASLGLVKTLLQRGVPLQAVALEAHIDAPWTRNRTGYVSFLRAVRDLGVEVYVTELDVNDTAVAGSDAEVEAAVAQAYRDYLEDVLGAGSMKRLIFWSMSDRFDWYGDLAATQPRWRRPDGRPHHLGLTDTNFAVNPAYASVREVIAGNAARSSTRSYA